MKKTVILFSSVVLNAVLAAVVITRTPTPPPQKVETAAPKPIVKTRVETVVLPGEKEVVTEWAKMDWRTIESNDYQKYIENLRKAGCPEETIRDLIIADVNKLYAAKWKGLHPVEQEWKYWEAESKRDKKDDRKNEERRALERERDDLIRSLLNVDLKSELAKYSWEQERAGRDARLAFLTEEKQTLVKDLDSRYRDEFRKVAEEGKAAGWTKEEMSTRLAALRKQHEKDLAGVLNSSELLEYELRNSSLAGKMRNELAWFEPNEQEFRAMYQRIKAAEEAAAAGGQRLSLEKDLAQLGDLRGILSETRWAELQQMQDPAYRDALKMAEKLHLNAEDTKLLAQINQTSENELAKVRTNPNLTPEQRESVSRAIKEEKKRVLNEALGKRIKRKD